MCSCDSYYNAESHSFDVERYNNTEPAYVDQVKMLFDDFGEKKYRVNDVAARSDRLQRVFIMLRVKVVWNDLPSELKDGDISRIRFYSGLKSSERA